MNFIPNLQHMVSRASDICRTTSGSNAWPERNPRIGMIGSYKSKSSPRLLHAESYESDKDHSALLGLLLGCNCTVVPGGAFMAHLQELGAADWRPSFLVRLLS